MPDFDAVDCFGGAGGVTVGLSLLDLTDVGLEWGADQCATRSAAGFPTIRTDVASYPRGRFAGIEGMWHSPPCPDWSTAGKRAGRDGSSGHLVDQPLEWARDLRPRWIACEQVPPVETVWREHALALQALGYHTWVGCLSAEQYGVPQTRGRAYLMAHLDHPVSPPQPTHQPYVPGVPAQQMDTWSGPLRPWVSMAEALGWGSGGEVNTRGDRQTPGGNEFATHRPSWTLTEKGRSWVVNTRRDQREDGSTQIRPFSSPSPTLSRIAGGQWVLQCDPPGGSVGAEDAGGPTHLTVHEALALQAMPVNYPVQGSRTSQFGQVGDLVCPFMAAAVVGEMLGLDWRSAVDAVSGGR